MASEIKVDTISEKTAANGVTIDGVVLKDNEMGSTYLDAGLVKLAQYDFATDGAASSYAENNFVDNTKYSHYEITLENIQVATNDTAVNATFRNGSSDITGNYRDALISLYTDLSSTSLSSNNSRTDETRIMSNMSNVSTERNNARCILFANSAVSQPHIWTDSMTQRANGDGHQVLRRIAERATSTAVTGIKFHTDSGNMTAGTITIYGVKR